MVRCLYPLCEMFMFSPSLSNSNNMLLRERVVRNIYWNSLVYTWLCYEYKCHQRLVVHLLTVMSYNFFKMKCQHLNFLLTFFILTPGNSETSYERAVEVNIRTLALHFAAVRSMGLLLTHKSYCPIISELDLEEPLRRLIDLATSSSCIQV